MIRPAVPRSSGSLLKRSLLLLVLSVLSTASVVRSQDAVRPSLAGEAASEARRQDIDRIPYNLLAGPVRFRFSATMGIEYNDNINLSDDGSATFMTPSGPFTVTSETEDDFIFRPQVNFNAVWPITQINTLRFDIGIGYALYLDHSNANTNGILISPGSQLAFDIFIGDFRINIHDRLSLQQDPISNGQLSNVIDYGRFENTAGISVLWDLNKVLLSIGYDHYNYISTTDDFDYLNRNSEILSGSASFAVASTTNVGVEGYAVYSYYDENVMNDAFSKSAGAFLETQLSNNLRLRVAGGYQWIDFDDNGLINDQEDLCDWYANILVSHRLNATISQSLAAGREGQLGVNSNYIDLKYVRHTITWNILRNTLLATEFFYEHAEDSGGFIDEHFQRYGGAATVGYQLTPHITLGLRYQYTEKDSDVVLRDYKQSRVSIDGTYSF